MDVGTKTIREVLTKKFKAEKAERILKKINDGCEQGKRGDDLKTHVQSVLVEEGVDRTLGITDVFFATPAGT